MITQSTHRKLSPTVGSSIKTKDLVLAFRLEASLYADKKNVLKNNKSFYEKLLKCLMKFTELHSHHKYDTLIKSKHAGYKKLTGNIKGYRFKFKLDQKYSVLSEEELKDDMLLIRLGHIGDFHKG